LSSFLAGDVDDVAAHRPVGVQVVNLDVAARTFECAGSAGDGGRRRVGARVTLERVLDRSSVEARCADAVEERLGLEDAVAVVRADLVGARGVPEAAEEELVSDGVSVLSKVDELARSGLLSPRLLPGHAEPQPLRRRVSFS
jgi:hypothetical protein